MTEVTKIKVSEMNAGKAVVLSDSEIDQINAAGIEARTAINAKQVGTLDRYIGWMVEAGRPANLRFGDDMCAYASI